MRGGDRPSLGGTRGANWQDAYWNRFVWSFGLAVAVHVILIGFFVVPSLDRGFESSATEIALIDVPPEVQIPPPPEEIARPATPVIAAEPVSEEVTIAETDIVEQQIVPETPPAPGPVGDEPEATFVFTPYTVKPKCTRGCTADDILKFIPPVMKKTGLSCTLTVGIRIDTNGVVTATDMLQSSGWAACDEATRRWAETTRWTTAYNRDQPVVVWVAQPVEVVVR